MLELLQPAKSLPQSEESERAVLAAVLLDPRLLPSVSGRLRAEDFSFERHKLLYGAMLELQDEQTTIDLRTVQARLEQKASFEAAGGLAYLAGLDLDLPDLGRFEQYVEIMAAQGAWSEQGFDVNAKLREVFGIDAVKFGQFSTYWAPKMGTDVALMNRYMELDAHYREKYAGQRMDDDLDL